MIQIRNVLQKWYRGSTVSFLTSQKTEIAKSACETKMTRVPSRRRTGEAVPRTEKFWWLDINRSQKVLSEGRRISKQSPTRTRGKRSCHSVDSILSVQNQDFSRDGKAESFSSRRKCRKSSIQTFLGNVANHVKNHHGIIVHQRLTDQKQMGLLRERYAKIKEELRQCRCNHRYLRNNQDPSLSDWKTPFERRLGEPFEGPMIPFGSMVEYHPFSARDRVKTPPIW